MPLISDKIRRSVASGWCPNTEQWSQSGWIQFDWRIGPCEKRRSLWSYGSFRYTHFFHSFSFSQLFNFISFLGILLLSRYYKTKEQNKHQLTFYFRHSCDGRIRKNVSYRCWCKLAGRYYFYALGCRGRSARAGNQENEERYGSSLRDNASLQMSGLPVVYTRFFSRTSHCNDCILFADKWNSILNTKLKLKSTD